MGSHFAWISSLCLLCLLINSSSACRVDSEQLREYTRKTMEDLVRAKYLETVFWPDEPLDAGQLSKATGLNITFAETRLSTETTNGQDGLIRDVFVACSVDRSRNYALTINLELDNPFKVLEIAYEPPIGAFKRGDSKQSVQTESKSPIKRQGRFRIRLPQSSFLVQLNQRVRYDECIVINYVQLEPSVSYDIECVDCSEAEQNYLDYVFKKRMSQFDAEIDSLLSEKFLLGLKLLFDQQRLDLELFNE